MVNPFLTEVKINGIDVSAKMLSWKTAGIFDDEIASAELEFVKSVLSLTTINNGSSITIKRGRTTTTDEFTFEGTVDNLRKDDVKTKVVAYDLLKTQAVDTIVTVTYDKDVDTSAGVGSEIFKDLINNYTDLTADATSVVDTGTTILLKTFILNNVCLWEKLKELCKIYEYIAFWNPTTQRVHFQPRGDTTIGTDLIVGDNIKTVPKWQFDSSLLLNDITILGAEQIVEDTELFDGDGSTTVFTLAKIPIVVNVTVDGIIKVAGVVGSSTSYDYTINKEQKTINFVSPPAGGTENVAIKYTNAIPVPINVSDATSIATYGRKEASKHVLNLQSVEDAEQYASAYLAKFKDPFAIVALVVGDTSFLAVGNRVHVIDSIQNEDRNLIITKIEKSWPSAYDTVWAGEKEFKLADWQASNMDRLKRLEELSTKNTEIIVHREQFSKEFVMYARPLSIYKEDRSLDTQGIYDNATRGVWDSTFTWASGSETYPTTLVRRVWNHKTFMEDFTSDDFIGAGTAELDTTNGVLK